jgi:hypothetical protein
MLGSSVQENTEFHKHSTNKKYENEGKIEWILHKPNNSLIIGSFKYTTNFYFINTCFSSLHGWNETEYDW